MGINNCKKFKKDAKLIISFFQKSLKKHPSELFQGFSFFAWKHMVSVKNNELVVDYPKLPKKGYTLSWEEI